MHLKYKNKQGYYIAMKRNEVLTVHATVQLNTENIISESSQARKATCHMTPVT